MSQVERVADDGFATFLSDAELRAFEARARPQSYRRGAALFSEGDRSERVLLVRSGRVKVSYYTRDGREVVLAVAGPGELLGELSAIDGEPRSATASALEAVETLVLSSAAFNAFLEEHPRVVIALMRMLSRRLRDSDRKRVEFGSYDAVGRLARRLLELTDRFGEEDDGGIRITLPLTQEELASWTGSSREAVVKALRLMRERGWITTNRREIVVRDTAALRQRAL